MLGGMFRQKALKKLSSPEQLDQLIVVTNMSGWIIYIAISILLVACIMLFFFGEIPVTIDGNGILIRGTGLHEIDSPGTGILSEIYIKENDIVEKDEIIGKVSQPEVEWKIKNLENQIEFLTKENIKENRSTIQNLKFELDELKGNFDLTSNIRATTDGRIISLTRFKDCFISQGNTLAIIEKHKEELEGIIYISADLAGLVKPGMKAQVSVASARSAIYGFIFGTVSYVGSYPTRKDRMMSLLENEELINKFRSKDEYMEVRVKLDKDPNNPSGYKWYSGKGPSFPLQTGTICNSKIIIRKFHPINLMFQKN